jgi:hypothetical protein
MLVTYEIERKQYSPKSSRCVMAGRRSNRAVRDPHRFPGEWFGYPGFLFGVFCLALYVYGKIY